MHIDPNKNRQGYKLHLTFTVTNSLLTQSIPIIVLLLCLSLPSRFELGSNSKHTKKIPKLTRIQCFPLFILDRTVKLPMKVLLFFYFAASSLKKIKHEF